MSKRLTLRYCDEYCSLGLFNASGVLLGCVKCKSLDDVLKTIPHIMYWVQAVGFIVDIGDSVIDLITD